MAKGDAGGMDKLGAFGKGLSGGGASSDTALGRFSNALTGAPNGANDPQPHNRYGFDPASGNSVINPTQPQAQSQSQVDYNQLLQYGMDPALIELFKRYNAMGGGPNG